MTPSAAAAPIGESPRGVRRAATPFFRDEAELAPFTALLRRRLHQAPAPGRQLRVWIPECGTGEDAYSAAILVIEAAGRRWRETQFAVLGTDPLVRDLEKARAGRFAEETPGLSAERRARFFEARHGWLHARSFLRAACRFSPGAEGEPPPHAGFDLIAARGLLGLLPAARRLRSLRAFHAALKPGGVLLDLSGAAADMPDLFNPVGRGRAYAALHGNVRAAPVAVDARLRESEERFRVLFAGASDAIVVRDAQTGLVVLANEAAARLFGWDVEELVGMHTEDLLAPPALGRRPRDERRAADRPALPRYRRKDGTSFPADVRESLLTLEGRACRIDVARDAAPRLRGTVSIIRERR